MHKVSVIIPCFNSETTIMRCIKSILNQTYNDFEIIVVDDCSTDNSALLVKELCCKYTNITLLKNTENSGPSLTRKNGIMHSESEFIMFCDSDDYYEPSCIEKMIFAAESNGAMVSACNYNIIKGSKIRQHNVLKTENIVNLQHALILPIDSMWCCCFKRTLFDDICFPNIRNGEDMAIIPLLILKSGKISCLEDCLYNYVYQKQSLSNSSSLKVVSNLEDSFQYIFENIQKTYIDEIEFLGIRNLIYGGLLYLFKCSNNKKYATKIISLFDNNFPNWFRNQYIIMLPFHKKLFVLFAKKRLFFLLKVLTFVHGLFVR